MGKKAPVPQSSPNSMYKKRKRTTENIVVTVDRSVIIDTLNSQGAEIPIDATMGVGQDNNLVFEWSNRTEE